MAKEIKYMSRLAIFSSRVSTLWQMPLKLRSDPKAAT